MSEDFDCEVCGLVGRRRRMAHVPDGWYFAEMVDGETGVVYVMGVCSEQCRNRFFRKGPGRMTTEGKEPYGP